jgi:hypothetical protein
VIGMNSKLINKVAYIIDKDSIYYNEWGTIKDYDGENYYITIANGSDSIPAFKRNEFIVRRLKSI